MGNEFESLKLWLAQRYRVEDEVGRGGMATVYRAYDLRHDRRVAVKVLRPELAGSLGPERFLREITLTARLDHPHILPLLDSGEAEGLLYYVMPYVEGESLRDRLNRERQLPVDDALQIAREVADALSHAHSLGIVHRDIKPENILLSAAHARVADFGIARAVEAAGGQTLTKLTATGIAAGTPLYMSPEQASGQGEVDGRTDIYSLACVIYEMLAGQPPYTGATPMAILARKSLEAVPSLQVVREAVPLGVEEAITKALAKVPADRYATAREFLHALQSGPGPESAAAHPGRRSPPLWLVAVRSPVLWILTLLVLGSVLIVRRDQSVHAPAPPPPAVFVLPLPAEQRLADGLAVAVSPDGTQFVYAAMTAEGTQLYRRPIDQVLSMAIPGSEGASQPFFSLDGHWIGFLADGHLKRIPSSGGQATTLARIVGGFGGASWAPDNSIFFAQTGPPSGIFRVAATGGAPQLVVAPATGEFAYWPSQISERGLLFSVVTGGMAFDVARIELLRLDTGERQVLIEEGNHPRYAESGHIIFAGRPSNSAGGTFRTTLRGVPFDIERFELRGSPVTLLEDIVYIAGTRAAQFDFSRTGSLVYTVSRPPGARAELLWVDRSGREEALGIQVPGLLGASLMIAPDGRHVGLTSAEGGVLSTWIADLERRTATPLSRGTHNSHFTVWSPLGDRVVFTSDSAGGAHNIYSVFTDRRDAPQRLTHSTQHQDPGSWSPDGRYLTFAELHSETGWDIWILDMASSPPIPRPLIRTPAHEAFPMISPDGQWLAYVSTESGRPEVYLERFPGLGGKQRVSQEGGYEPLWSRDGSELFYTSGETGTPCPEGDRGDVCVWRVPVTLGAQPILGAPTVLFIGGSNVGAGWGWPRYDLSPDGRRFLVMRTGGLAPPSTEFLVTLNWFTDLTTRAAAK